MFRPVWHSASESSVLDDGVSYPKITDKLSTLTSTISRWKERYDDAGMLGLATTHPGQQPRKLTPLLRVRVLEKTRQAPPDGSTHWSLRNMAALMQVNKNLIARIWKEAELKPHRLEPAKIRSLKRKQPTSSAPI